MSAAVLAEVTKASPPPAVLAAATFSLGFARSHAGDHAEAEGHFREALKWQAEANAKHWTAAKYKAWLGFALHAQKKDAAAEPVLTEAYAEGVERLAEMPVWERHLPAAVAGKLLELYERLGKPELAKKWQAERAMHTGPDGAR